MIKEIIKEIFHIPQIKLMIFKNKFRKINSHNFMEPENIFNINNVKIGNYSYGKLLIKNFGNDKSTLKIGSYCSIASNVKFFLAGGHDYKNISTYPFRNKFYNESESISKGNIIIGDDVWIGDGAIILSGVKIGQGAIIGTGSVVSKDIPPYAIFAGNKIIKYRFDEEIISKLLKIDFSKLDKDKIEKNLDLLYENCNKENIDDILLKLF